MEDSKSQRLSFSIITFHRYLNIKWKNNRGSVADMILLGKFQSVTNIDHAIYLSFSTVLFVEYKPDFSKQAPMFLYSQEA